MSDNMKPGKHIKNWFQTSRQWMLSRCIYLFSPQPWREMSPQRSVESDGEAGVGGWIRAWEIIAHWRRQLSGDCILLIPWNVARRLIKGASEWLNLRLWTPHLTPSGPMQFFGSPPLFRLKHNPGLNYKSEASCRRDCSDPDPPLIH